MKELKKILSFLLSVAMVLSIVVIPKTTCVYAADDGSNANEDYTYFPVTMFKYNTDTFNNATRALEENGQQGIYFNSGAGTAGWNKWTGSGGGVYTGIAKSSLTNDGDIQFNYKEAGIFDTSKSTGKTFFTDVKMPFKLNSDGYYYYDSDNYDVYFKNGQGENGATLIANDNQKIMNCNNNVGNKKGFFPFNGNGNYTPKYHFGMNMAVNFYMTENGYVDGDKNKKPITFEFSGDDDVWVYVDGKLVLDIGGIHNKTEGKIDFSTGYTEVNGKASTNIYNILGDADTWRADTDKPHSLQVFYLERGEGASNCKIQFNLPQRDKIEVSKVLGNIGATDEDLGALAQQSFEFQLLSSDSENGEYKPCASSKYALLKNGAIVKRTKTDENGKFTLEFNQKALFYRRSDITPNKYYKVVETKKDTDTYNPSWKMYKNGQIQGSSVEGNSSNALLISKSEGSIKKVNTYSYECTNTFEPSATDDIVVLDYGKKVTIDVLANDVLLGAKKNISNLDSSNCKNGTLENSNNKLVYKPNKFMNSVDEATYKVKINNITPNKEVSAKVSIMPATSVYYEDDFGKEDNKDANIAIVWSDGGWSKDGTSQDEEQSDKNSQYGWDDSYKDDTGYSNGFAHVSSQNFATATFRFTGTGVDVYSRTNEGVGKISTSLKKVTKDADGKETVKTIKYKSIDNLSVSGDYYQIPTLNYDDLDYGTYEVTIKVITVSAENRGTYYLDGIRVYNPLGKVDANSVAGKAYKEAGESNAQYIQVRKDLLDSSKVQSIDTTIKGSLFIDKSANKVGDRSDSIGTYKDYGPKNEVYLKSYIDKSDTTKNKIQGVAFNINGYNSDNNKVFIGLKSPTGKEVTVKVTSGEKTEEIKLNSAADLYYEITPTEKGNVVIENMSDNLLSITKVRITGEISTTNGYALTSTPELMSYVNTFDALQEKQDTNQKDTEDTLDKGDVDINNPGDNDTNKDDSSQDNNEQTKPNNTWNKIMNSIKSWFRR